MSATIRSIWLSAACGFAAPMGSSLTRRSVPTSSRGVLEKWEQRLLGQTARVPMGGSLSSNARHAEIDMPANERHSLAICAWS